MDILKKILDRFGPRKEKASGHFPAVFWFWAVSFFFVLLLVTVLALAGWYLRIRSLDLAGDEGAIKTEKLDEKNFQSIKDDYIRRSAEYLKLEAERPTVVDPGV
ncbi:MAG: hypothetical protein NTY66_03025 [Candidatus Vogelbacteria bacterium]|nr:hypothetical protein [Candidatus Vogelbacteria bacterium]